MSRNEAAQSQKAAIPKTTQGRKQEDMFENCPSMSEHEADKLEESEPVSGKQMGCIVKFMVCCEKKCMSVGMSRKGVGLGLPIRLTTSSKEEEREVNNVKLKNEVACLSRPFG